MSFVCSLPLRRTIGQMEAMLDMQFARGWTRRLRGAVKAAGALKPKRRLSS